MATNVHFSQQVQTEQNLVEDLVVESLRMYGHNVYYLPRKIVNEDTILGDAANSSFEDAYEVEMYLEGVEGFEGEGDLYSKFGVEVRDTANFVISRRSWERFVSLDANLATGLRPNEGDLIYFPLSKSLFEINFVEHEDPFYQMNKLFVFKMQCSLFEYSGEKFDTEVVALDTDLELAQGQAIEFTLSDNSAMRAFVQGESVSQLLTSTIVATGIVSAWSETTNKLTISSIKTTDTGDPATYTSFMATDVTEGVIVGEDTIDNDKIIMNTGHYIDFESGTVGIEFPSTITDGTTGTDNIAQETAGDFLLESGTATDVSEHDTLILEDSLISRRSIVSIAAEQTLPTDPGAFNVELETTADGIIDFSEGNPFGEAT